MLAIVVEKQGDAVPELELGRDAFGTPRNRRLATRDQLLAVVLEERVHATFRSHQNGSNGRAWFEATLART